MNKIEILYKVARSYNTLNYEILKKIASKDIIYESQAVIKPLNGKRELGKYFRGKFKTIKESGQLVYAEIGFFCSCNIKDNIISVSDKAQVCIILAQGNKKNIVAYLLVGSDDSFVHRIDLCLIPPHSSILVGTDIFPS